MNDDCPRCAGIGFKHAQCPSCKTGPWEVSDVTRQLIERDQHGRQKYGVTLDRTDLSHADWLQHMAEELMDGAGYALAAKREYERMQQGVGVPRDVLLAWRAEWMQNNPPEGDDCDHVTPFDAYLYSDPSVPPMSPAGYRVQGVGVNHTTGGFAWIHIDGVSFDAQLVARRMMQAPQPDASQPQQGAVAFKCERARIVGWWNCQCGECRERAASNTIGQQAVDDARVTTANALAVLERLAAHVRPTCRELYDEAVDAMSRVRSS